MNKRKIEVNQLKKTACKGKKMRTITVKYETVLSYFKQKDTKDLPVFQLTFPPLIADLLTHLSLAEFVDKLQNESKQPIKTLPVLGTTFKLESFELKALSKEYPIQELCGCLYIQGGDRKVLSICKNKLMSFFKNLRIIYTDFCYCAGEKVIVETGELKLLYDLFVAQWNKNQEKGRLSALERLQNKLRRSLYFLGILIENNIIEAIESAQKRKREEQSDCGTRSEHKKNIKGIGQQVSTVHSFASLDPSTQSVRLKSQTSQEQNFTTLRNNLSMYSQKSQKVVSRSRFGMWDKAQLKQLKFSINNQIGTVNDQEVQKYEINLLSNDVENILIEKAFNMQKFTDIYEKHETVSTHQYCLVDYANNNSGQGQYQNNGYQYGGYPMGSYMPYSYVEMYPQQHHYPQYLPSMDYHSGDTAELSQLKRSLGCLNLVQTRKKDKDRYQ